MRALLRIDQLDSRYEVNPVCENGEVVSGSTDGQHHVHHGVWCTFSVDFRTGGDRFFASELSQMTQTMPDCPYRYNYPLESVLYSRLGHRM